jgi:ribonuclease HI
MRNTHPIIRCIQSLDSHTEHASIFTAELQAIYQALDYTFKLDENVPAVAIYCDSKWVVSSIASSAPGNNESLHGVRETNG